MLLTMREASPSWLFLINYKLWICPEEQIEILSVKCVPHLCVGSIKYVDNNPNYWTYMIWWWFISWWLQTSSTSASSPAGQHPASRSLGAAQGRPDVIIINTSTCQHQIWLSLHSTPLHSTPPHHTIIIFRHYIYWIITTKRQLLQVNKNSDAMPDHVLKSAFP